MITLKIVSKNSGESIENARVSLYYGMLGNYSHDGRTDHQGEVHFEAKSGQYTITVKAPNFSKKINLNPGYNVIYV
jgi:hypothetical protein